MNKIVAIVLLIGLAACGESMITDGAIQYRANELKCEAGANIYWLMEMEARTGADSLLFNTRQLGHKLEVHSDQMVKTSGFYKILSRLCVGDSIFMVLPTDSFYLAMSGVRPLGLKDEKITLNITLLDQLNELQYMAHKLAFEQESMAKYVQKFRWNATFDSTTGIYYEKLKVARNAESTFTKAKMSYVIKTIDDRLVDRSSEDRQLIFDQSDLGLLKGLRFVGSLLNEGESIRAIIPSTMAFGRSGFESVGPFQPIIVEMEVEEILE